VVMGVTGPFGTYYGAGLAVRLVFFTSTAILIWLQVLLFAALLARFEVTQRWPLLLRRAIACALASIPCTAPIILLNSWLVRPIPWRAAWEIYPQTAFLTIVISMVIGLYMEWHLRMVADNERARVAEIPTADTPKDASPDFFRRVPPAL